MDNKLLLSIQAACNDEGVKLPWDKIASFVDENISEGAVIQHLSKLRQRMVEQGLSVPQALKRGGAATRRASSARGTGTLPSQGATTTRRASAAGRLEANKKAAGAGTNGDTGDDDQYESDEQDEGSDYGSSQAKRSKKKLNENNLPGGEVPKPPKRVKAEDSSEDEKPIYKKRKAVPARKGYQFKKPPVPNRSRRLSTVPASSSETMNEPSASEAFDGGQNVDEDQDTEVQPSDLDEGQTNEDKDTEVELSDAESQFEGESAEQIDDDAEQGEEPKPSKVVVLRISKEHRSDRYPLGLGHWPDTSLTNHSSAGQVEESDQSSADRTVSEGNQPQPLSMAPLQPQFDISHNTVPLLEAQAQSLSDEEFARNFAASAATGFNDWDFPGLPSYPQQPGVGPFSEATHDQSSFYPQQPIIDPFFNPTYGQSFGDMLSMELPSHYMSTPATAGPPDNSYLTSNDAAQSGPDAAALDNEIINDPSENAEVGMSLDFEGEPGGWDPQWDEFINYP
ncbi:MAG: hypothetical protein M1819_006508 [Sarea resinae]|nr:MAG: hypothetical protein M1819_006508 [Sarea resinae]